jgi:hypothetical protein
MENQVQIFPIIFSSIFTTLFVMVLIWFWLTHKLFKMLSASHPSLYKEMGEPSLFMNNTPGTVMALFKFLFGRRYLGTGNKALEKHGGTMFAFAIVYIALFLALILSSVLLAP